MRGEDTEKESIEDRYVPASQEALQAYARAVCEALGEDYNDPMLARELGQFLKTVSTIQAKQLNQGGSVDSEVA